MRTFPRIVPSIYGDQCLYCILEGKQFILKINTISHSRCAYKIGHHDGYSGKTLLKMNCYYKDLPEFYMDGYAAGKTMRELEECKERFCILFPDFLAKLNK